MSLTDLETQFYMRRRDTPGAMLAPLMLPGLRAFWYCGSAFNSNSQWIAHPLSERMSMTGTISQGRSTTWPLVEYVTIDGDGEYCTKADDAIISPTGDMTIGIWLTLSASGTKRGVLNKWFETGNERSYVLYASAADAATFDVSSDGGAINLRTVAGPALVVDQWELVVGRIECDVSQDVYVSGTWARNAVNPLSSVYDCSRELYLSRHNETSGNSWRGNVAQFWLCGYAVPDAWIDWLWLTQAPHFGRA
jgi:hypothetical protein